MCCCCCCCPPAVNALFCLWARSGFSKASVAGALTFFPPDPPLYKFQRISKDGEPLSDEDDDDVGDSAVETPDNQLSLSADSPIQSMAPELDEEHQLVGVQQVVANGKTYVEDRAETPESVSKSLSEQNAKLRRKARIRNTRDAADAASGVTFLFVPDPRLAAPPHFSGTVTALKIGPQTKTKNYIAAVLCRLPPDQETRTTKTIIYSHGNATDIGAMNFMQCLLSNDLAANVLMYDYSGYGSSGGIPLEANTYRDIQSVYQYVVDHVVPDRDESQIVIYGQSVGSGPSCYLCSKKNVGMGGLILHSPFMSGMRVLTPSRALACLDIFPNIDRIRQVQCPVMVIHGMKDQEVDFCHGKALHDAVPPDLQRDPWWVRDRGHNDVTDGPTKTAEYIRRLTLFLNSLDAPATSPNNTRQS